VFGCRACQLLRYWVRIPVLDWSGLLSGLRAYSKV